jgi:hypothetical protein
VETHHSAQRDARRAASEPGPRLKPPQYRRLLPFEDPEETETCNIAVMEVRWGRRTGGRALLF